MKKILIPIILILLITISVRAQEKAAAGYSPTSLYTISWAVSLPIGDFSNFINKLSFGGGSFAGRYFVKKGLALGFEFGWNNYYQEYPRETYYGSDGLAITGIHYMYAFIIPWEAGAYYYFIPSGIADPYVGLSLGGDYMEEHILIQEYDIYKTQWGFIMSPEAGVLFKFGRYSHWGANISAKYWFNTNSFSFTGNKTYDLMQGLNFNIGLCYLLR